jgi:hypothetical protein
LSAANYSFSFTNGTLTVMAVSPPSIISIGRTNGVITITWSSVASMTYRVQYTGNLNNPNWTDLPPDVTATGPTASKTDVIGNTPQRFYRVMLVQPAVPAPVISSISLSNGIVTITWSSVAGRKYELQSETSLNNNTWSNLPPVVTAVGPTASQTAAVGSAPQLYYRVLLQLP